MPDTLPADSHRATVAASKPGPAPAKDMAWIPEGEFLMGSDDFYPEGAPGHRVAVDGFWIDEHPVTVAEFRRFVKATGYVTWSPSGPRTRPTTPTPIPPARPRIAGVPPDLRDRSISVTSRTGGRTCPARDWRHPEGPDSTLHGRERYPVTHVAYRGRRGVRHLGREGAADRGAVGVRGARWAGRQDLLLGGRVRPARQDDGQHLAGRVPLAEPDARPFRADLAGQALPAERLWPVRHGRQRLGMDRRLLCGPSRRPTPVACLLHAAKSASGLTRPELRPRRPGPTSRAGSSRAARTCAPPTTACATAPPRAKPRRSTPRPATSDSAASLTGSVLNFQRPCSPR